MLSRRFQRYRGRRPLQPSHPARGILPARRGEPRPPRANRFRLPRAVSAACHSAGRREGEGRSDARDRGDAPRNRAGKHARPNAGPSAMRRLRIPQLLCGHLVIFAKGGRFDANLAVAKNCAGISHAKPRFFEAISAASNRSPMRRGLKRSANRAMGQSLMASNRSPMRRGLKRQYRRMDLRGGVSGFKPIPDEEGTETPIHDLQDARDRASNRSPMRRGLKRHSCDAQPRGSDASNRSPMRRGLKPRSQARARD